MPDKNNITVSMSLKDFEYYQSMEDYAKEMFGMLQRANQDGKIVMTEELRIKIEDIYLPEASPW